MNANRLVLLLLIAAALIWTCSFQVAEAETALVTRFGGVQRSVDEPGLHFKLPIDQIMRVDRRVRVLEVEVGEVLTAESAHSEAKNIEVAAFLGWSVVDPDRFLRSVGSIERAEISLASYLDSTVGTVLNARPMTDLVGIQDGDSGGPKLDEVNAQILELVAGPARSDLGIEVSMAQLLRVGFPLMNKDSVYKRMSAERNERAAAIKAEAMTEATRIENTAKEQNQKIVSDAEAEAKRIKGDAEAEAASILREAAQADPEWFEWLLSLDVQREALGSDDTVIIPVDPDGPLGRLLRGDLGATGTLKSGGGR